MPRIRFSGRIRGSKHEVYLCFWLSPPMRIVKHAWGMCYLSIGHRRGKTEGRGRKAVSMNLRSQVTALAPTAGQTRPLLSCLSGRSRSRKGALAAWVIFHVLWVSLLPPAFSSSFSSPANSSSYDPFLRDIIRRMLKSLLQTCSLAEAEKYSGRGKKE